ncbi:MAG: serpin family protein [Streptosporangiaceae bacterium]|nr:serpin family protein [Streptosporangiaceae bacterium]MBV9856960.1 serpin family protein [Streptosporangiaceae bacterium]
MARAGGGQLTAAIAADAAFGTDLYRRLSAGAGNVVFSPASIAAALRMALCGARGETAAELAAALHLNGPEEAPEGLAAMGSIRAGDDVTFRAPNTMWVQSGFPLRQEFLASLAATVSAETADFMRDAEGARERINDTVSDQTEGKITDLLPRGLIDYWTRLVLVNAVYLKAPWASPFPAAGTRDSDFYTERNGTSRVPMMHLEASLSYRRGDGYAAVLLPYRGSDLAMAIVLPDGPLASLETPLTREGLRGVLDGLRAAPRVRMRLDLPKFRLTAGFRLDDTLKALGVVLAFDDTGRADFSGITEAKLLRIKAVVHKAYIDVDEQGTEAAAATAVVMQTLSLIRPPDPVVTMIVDRPFLFAITDTATGLPLFLGQVARP